MEVIKVNRYKVISFSNSLTARDPTIYDQSD